MSTGRGEGSLKLVRSIFNLSKIQPFNISFIFCNREKGESPKTDLFLSEIEEYKIPLITLSSKKHIQNTNNNSDRIEYEKKIEDSIKEFDFQFILGVGYLLIIYRLHKKFIIYNLHPALPGGPKGTWGNVISELISKDFKETGLMIHEVSDDLDDGKVISFCKFQINNNSNKSKEEKLKLIRSSMLDFESRFVAKTLELISINQINYRNNKKPVDISNLI
jgi:folate-dependent phosphoribosylglycinamide formyltransferase PurN